mgnify:CR=1 FL=1
MSRPMNANPPAIKISGADHAGTELDPSGTSTSATAESSAPPPSAMIVCRSSVSNHRDPTCSIEASNAPTGMAAPASSVQKMSPNIGPV